MTSRRARWKTVVLTLLFPGPGHLFVGACSPADHTVADADLRLEARLEGLRNPETYVTGGSVEPRWLPNGNGFWFIKHGSTDDVLIVVDPTTNAASPPVSLSWLERNLLTSEDDSREASLVVAAVEPLSQTLDSLRLWIGENSYTVQAQREVLLVDRERLALPPAPQRLGQNILAVEGPQLEAFVRSNNVWIRDLRTGRERQATSDGSENSGWWIPSADPGSILSPDGLLGVFLKEVSWPQGRHRAPRPYLERILEVWKRRGAMADGAASELVRSVGLSRANFRPFLVHLRDGSTTPLPVPDLQRTCVDDVGEEHPCYETYDPIGWLPDGSEFLLTQAFQDSHRDHVADLQGHDLRLLAFNPATGAVRTLIEEGEGLHVLTAGGGLGGATWLLSDDTFLWLSERDGWRHIYRYDLAGRLLGQLTSGPFPVDWIQAVDEDRAWVYFTGSDDPARPYDLHLYRVRLDGSGFDRLTEAPGVHDAGVLYREEGVGIEFSPSLEYFLDSHSAVDRPPTVELRRSDGAFVRVVDEADVSRLEAELGWTPPEEFVVKDADGSTDLHGVLYRPSNFDPVGSYPVIEFIHHLPEAILVEHGFSPAGKALGRVFELRGLAEMGFVVVKVDTRGTGGRGRSFSDWALLPNKEGDRITDDHVATLQQLAQQRPWMDLSRVGIIGASRGSLQALRAMTLAPGVYRAGVTVSTIVGTGFTWELAETGVIPLLERLEGRHLMIQGTEDGGFIDVLRLSEEYRRLSKQHRVVILPGAGHVPQGEDRAFMNATIRDFFSREFRN